MATTWKITKVKTEKSASGTHEHIARVEVNNSEILRWSRQTVVNDLRNINGDRYYTEAEGIKADVIAVSCPHCGASDYITTKPDSTTKNNLLSLPRFY